MFDAKVICDSVSLLGCRLTTITATYPRFIHSEVMTHRDRARNAASSRAIPWRRMYEAIQANPVIPIRWGAEQRGMQTGGEIPEPDEATQVWLQARDSALRYADSLASLGVHKSLVNRITEPWMWITVVMTATEWNNFFRLRCHPDAEIHFQRIAGLIRDAIRGSTPQLREYGAWHLPFVSGVDQDELIDVRRLGDEDLRKISVARCARVSYLTHDGVRDPQQDLELFHRLVQGSGFGHWSPHEHVAAPSRDPLYRSGPFVGWIQYRKQFEQENAPG